MLPRPPSSTLFPYTTLFRSLPDPWVRIIPVERDGAIVQLERSPPPALPVQEGALAVESARICRVLPERAGDEGLRRAGAPEAHQAVPEPEDPPLVPRVHVEDGLEEEDRVVQLPADPELVRLQEEVRGLRRVEPKDLFQTLDRVGEVALAEEEVRLLVPGLAVSAIQGDDTVVALEGLRRAAEHDHQLRLVEPRGLVVPMVPEVLLDHPEGALVIPVLEEEMGLLPEVQRRFRGVRRDEGSNLLREVRRDAIALFEGTNLRPSQRLQVRERGRDRLRGPDRHPRDGVEELHHRAPEVVLLRPGDPLTDLPVLRLERGDLRDRLLLPRSDLHLPLLDRLRPLRGPGPGSGPGTGSGSGPGIGGGISLDGGAGGRSNSSKSAARPRSAPVVSSGEGSSSLFSGGGISGSSATPRASTISGGAAAGGP